MHRATNTQYAGSPVVSCHIEGKASEPPIEGCMNGFLFNCPTGIITVKVVFHNHRIIE